MDGERHSRRRAVNRAVLRREFGAVERTFDETVGAELPGCEKDAGMRAGGAHRPDDTMAQNNRNARIAGTDEFQGSFNQIIEARDLDKLRAVIA